jgi:multidrug efflux system membrane fusion protein
LETLKFENDKGAWRSRIVTTLITFAIFGWIGSSFIPGSDETKEPNISVEIEKPVLKSVLFEKIPMTEEFSEFETYGETEPFNDTAVIANNEGFIDNFFKKNGDMVKKGEVILKFENTKQLAALGIALENFNTAKTNLNNGQTLLNRKAITLDKFRGLSSSFKIAQAELRIAKDNNNATEIVAAHDGKIQSINSQNGVFTPKGTQLFQIIDNSRLKIKFRFSQKYIGKIIVGSTINIVFPNDTSVFNAEITFIELKADTETRTFEAEAIFENPNRYAAGISASIKVQLKKYYGHTISPAVIILGDDGVIGVKAVNEKNKITFHTIDIIKTNNDGVFVSGIPKESNIIVRGSGSVEVGESVKSVERESNSQ